jgi:ankyrin repeat protein
MSLLEDYADEVAFLAEDLRCTGADSGATRAHVEQLSKKTQAYKTSYLHHSTMLDLGNLVRCAMQAQISPDTIADTGDHYQPMLVVGARNGSIRAVRALLQGGANIDITGQDNHGTALTHASRKGHLACVQLLLGAGANANAQSWLGLTPLMVAVMHHHVECARALLSSSDLLLTNRAGGTAYHLSVSTASTECFELLLPLMSDLDVRTVCGRYGPQGRDAAATPFYCRSALHLASAHGQQPMAKTLLKRGASRMARDLPRQVIPLHLAAQYGHLSCVVVLVGRPGKVLMTPAEVNAADVDGFTALHIAAYKGFDKICGVLIGAGARLDAKTSDGITPLMIAQRYQPANAALHALLSGAGPAQLPGTVCDHCGKTAAQASIPSLKTCGACHGMRFCSAACQKAAWPGHKPACKARVAEREERTKVAMV